VLDYKALKNLNKFPGKIGSRPELAERKLLNREKTADLCLSLGVPPEIPKFVYPFNSTGYAS